MEGGWIWRRSGTDFGMGMEGGYLEVYWNCMFLCWFLHDF